MSPAPEFSSRAVEMWGTFKQNGPKKKSTQWHSGWNQQSKPTTFHGAKCPSIKTLQLDSVGGVGGLMVDLQVGWNPRNMEGPTPTPWQKTKALPDLRWFFRPTKGLALWKQPGSVSFHRKRYFGRMGGQCHSQRNGKSILSDLILCQNKTWSVSYHTTISI